MDQSEAKQRLDVSESASRDEITARYHELYSDLQVRLMNAPTASLRQMSQRNLAELKGALEVLCPGQAVDQSLDLPSVKPVVERVASPGAKDSPTVSHDLHLGTTIDSPSESVAESDPPVSLIDTKMPVVITIPIAMAIGYIVFVMEWPAHFYWPIGLVTLIHGWRVGGVVALLLPSVQWLFFSQNVPPETIVPWTTQTVCFGIVLAKFPSYTKWGSYFRVLAAFVAMRIVFYGTLLGFGLHWLDAGKQAFTDSLFDATILALLLPLIARGYITLSGKSTSRLRRFGNVGQPVKSQSKLSSLSSWFLDSHQDVKSKQLVRSNSLKISLIVLVVSFAAAYIWGVLDW